jgi:hypothetical protein
MRQNAEIATHIRKYRAEPAQIEAALLRHVLHQLTAAGGQHRCPLPTQFPDLGQARIPSLDLDAQSLADQLQVGEMQEEHGAVKSLPEVAFGGKLRVQEFTKAVPSARSDPVHRTDAAPRHALAGYRG